MRLIELAQFERKREMQSDEESGGSEEPDEDDVRRFLRTVADKAQG